MSDENDDTAVEAARLAFRDALLHVQRVHGDYAELEAATAGYCHLLRSRGWSPERTLITAKQVIHEAIHDHDRRTAERTVLMCIQHYFSAAPPKDSAVR